MGKSLFCEAAMYVGRKSARAAGTVIGVSAKQPDRIVLTHLNTGMILATTIDRGEVSELCFDQIDTIAVEGNEGSKHMCIQMADGERHLFAFKKEKKARAAVETLNRLKQATQYTNSI